MIRKIVYLSTISLVMSCTSENNTASVEESNYVAETPTTQYVEEELGHTEYEYIHSFGDVVGKGNLKNGNKNGIWEFYNSNGDLVSKGRFKDGVQNGYWEFHHDIWDLWHGEISEKGNYKNGVKNGPWVWYSEPGRIASKGNYLNDKKYGFWVEYKYVYSYEFEKMVIDVICKGNYNQNGNRDGEWLVGNEKVQYNNGH